MADTMLVHEIYLSLQGESTFAGLPCIFVRLAGCDLRCSYCDTAYAFGGGERTTVAAVVDRVSNLAEEFGRRSLVYGEGAATKPPLVELTGGEPLLQKAAPQLLRALCDLGKTVLLETSGAHAIHGVDPRVHRIVDLKCPSSGESERNHWDNISDLRSTDEVKFVISSEQDYVWAKEQLAVHGLAARCAVLFSWASPLTAGQQHASLKPFPSGHRPITRQALVEQIITDGLPVRFQLQMHKFIWPPDQRGV